MKRVTIYHNPRCSKSRKTLELIREKGIEPEQIAYLQTPPDVDTIRFFLDKLNLKPRELMRPGEDIYKSLNLDDESLSDELLIQAMHDNPRLIERPIVVASAEDDVRVVLGRPPENVLEIL